MLDLLRKQQAKCHDGVLMGCYRVAEKISHDSRLVECHAELPVGARGGARREGYEYVGLLAGVAGNDAAIDKWMVEPVVAVVDRDGGLVLYC